MKENLKIIFMGTPEFAVPCLDILIKNSFNIAAVVTPPDKPQGRGLKLIPTDIKKYALENNLKILQPDKLKDPEFIKQMEEISPDIIVVVAFRILPKEIYMIPKLGSFNLHASLLPKYRGAAPINWAIMKGEKETGVTTFFLEEKVDTGNMIIQEKVNIGENETAGELHDKLSALGAEVVLKTVNLIIDNNAATFKQNDSLTCPAPKIHKEDCRIDWKKDANEIHNFIRGLSPYPAAYTLYNKKILKIYNARPHSMIKSSNPGALFNEGNLLYVCTGNGYIQLLEIQIEGKKRMNVQDFLRGHKITSGESFE